MAIIMGAAMLSGSDIPLSVGDEAPDFTLLDENGDPHTLSDYRGQRVVVYFYPKDNTPGCIKEACNFRDHFDGFEKDTIKVLGISYDTPESHKKFKEKYSLPFTLLSDRNKDVAKMYGAGGLLYPKRITFLLGKDGRILHIYDKVSVTTHGPDILQNFSSRQVKE
ncbi:MAG: peroxiredoxin [Candidatus Neomarinimicrobiota bacterium]